MRSIIGCLAVVALVLVTAGCGSGSTGSPGTSPGAPAAVPTAPPAAVGSECSAIPTYSTDPDQPTPALTRDTALEGRFPQQVDGQPVTDVQSGLWLEAICMFGGQEGVDRLRNASPAGVSFLAMTYANGEATLGDEDVTINAFRLPGGDAGTILQSLNALSSALGTDQSTFTINLQPGTAGGKNVQTYTDEDGSVSYAYVSGDTLWVADGITQEQADKIFAAIP